MILNSERHTQYLRIDSGFVFLLSNIIEVQHYYYLLFRTFVLKETHQMFFHMFFTFVILVKIFEYILASIVYNRLGIFII